MGEVLVRPADRPGDLGWVVMAHGEVYAAEFGWDTSFEALVARIVADYADERSAGELTADQRSAGELAAGELAPGVLAGGELAGGKGSPGAAAWIAELAGERVGCVFCVRGPDDETAKLRILLVHPDGRGLGLGATLVDTCLEFARSAGYRRMMLWTNDPLAAARRIYLSRGFRLVAEDPHHSFGVDLVGQTYELDLIPG